MTSTTDTPPAPSAPLDTEGGIVFTRYRRTQLLVGLASLLCFLLFWECGRIMGIPAQYGFQDSLLQQGYWPLDLIALDVLLAVSVALGTLIGGRSWFFSGLFCATVGLAAISIRGGPLHDILFHAAAASNIHAIFLVLAFEQCLLFIPIALIWIYFWRLYHRATALPPAPPEPAAHDSNVLMAVAAQVVAMGIVVWLLAATDAKKQVLVGVFFGGLAGTALADYIVPHRNAPGWYWVGPLLVGVVGYLLAWFNANPWTTGGPNGLLAALARPLPLDYASAGSAGALLGYWISAERPRAAFSIQPASSLPAARDKAV